MGGKSATTTQQVSIPPEVMARYRAVNQRAEQTAQTPFQPYSYNPSDFVAPLNQTQQAGVNNIGAAQNIAQPYFQAGTALTAAGAGPVGRLQSGQINEYLSPYLNNVLGTTMQAMDRQNAIQRNDLTGNAIRSGAFGGDRAGIAQANLAYDQSLANSQTIAGILNQGYGQAVQTAQGQQGVQAQDLQRMLAAGQQFAGLGTGATQNALQAGQALLGAGTLGQQTDQAGLSALYNQFLQERGYPFQVAQFLANIAMGTGALSGSTTNTTQPVPFFSDSRLKEDIAPVGETYDGQQIYRYKMKGDPRPQIGLMADEVEERRPDAVGLAAGFRTLDYGRATDEAAQMGREGGLAPRGAYAPGGAVAPDDIRMLLEAQRQSFGPFAQAGLYGGSPQQGGAGKPGYVPQASLPVGKLMTAGRPPELPRSTASELMRGAEGVRDLGKTANDLWEGGKSVWEGRPEAKDAQGNVTQTKRSGVRDLLGFGDGEEERKKREGAAYGGGVVPGYAMGGPASDDDDEAQPISAYKTPGPGIDIPDQQSKNRLPEPGRPPNAPKSVFSDIMDGAKFAASLYTMSDRRLKDNIDPVGETYDGQNIYRYDMGDGRTQLGLMAQEVAGRKPEAVGERGGYLTLDYDRATEEAIPRAYGGGLVPRQGYQAGGVPEEIDLDRAAAAIRRRESSDRYDVLGPVTRRRDGSEDRPYGAYQVMGRNIGPWTQEALGRTMTSDEFLGDREAQDAVFRHHFGKAAQRYGTLEDAASVWFSGRPVARAGNSRDVLGTTVPNYVRDIRNSYDGGSQSQQLAYAPTGGVAGPAQGAIASAAPPPGGLGGGAQQARQQAQQTPPAQQAREEPGVLERMTPNNFRGQPQKPGEFLSSKQFWIPLLTGLGTMASSNSLFAGSAILQGLGGAAQAYSNLEKREADIGQTRAGEQATLQQAKLTQRQAVGASIIRDAQGVPMFVIVNDPKTGKTIQLDFGEAYRRRYELNLDPSLRGEIEAEAAKSRQPPAPPVGGGSGGISGGPGPAGVMPGVQAPAEAPSGPTDGGLQVPPAVDAAPVATGTTFALNDTDRQLIASEVNALAGVDRSKIPDTFGALQQRASDALEQEPLVMQLASAASSLPDVGPLSLGALAPYARAGARGLNSLFSVFGMERPVNEQQLKQAENLIKLVNQMTTRSSSEAGQTSYAAFRDIAQGFPTMASSREAFAKNIAEIVVANRAAINADRYAKAWREYARTINPALSASSGQALEQRFRDRFNAQLEQDRKSIERMFLEPIPGAFDNQGRPTSFLKDPETGANLTWMRYVTLYGSSMPEEHRRGVEQRFGAGILQYFPAVPRS